MTRRALVTGGASGLGAATADRLRNDDIEVVTLDRDPAADVVVDITDADGVLKAVAAMGPIDILINSAGIVGPNLPLWEVPPTDWARTFAVNVQGTFHVCRAVVPSVRRCSATSAPNCGRCSTGSGGMAAAPVMTTTRCCAAA